MTRDDARDADAAGEHLERTLQVLWDLDRSPTRGPKASISRADIVAAAVEVADTAGYDALSMRAVAEHLAAGTMSLYRHVPSRADLIALMVDRVSGEAPLPHEHPGTWREQLAQAARDWWALLHRHPWMLRVPLGRVSPGPHAIRHFDSALTVALRTGLPPAEALLVYGAVDELVMGSARSSTEDRAFLQETGVSTAQWWEKQGPLLGGVLGDGQFPSLELLVEKGAFGEALDGHDAEVFEHSLRLLLDGISARVAEHAAQSAAET